MTKELVYCQGRHQRHIDANRDFASSIVRRTLTTMRTRPLIYPLSAANRHWSYICGLYSVASPNLCMLCTTESVWVIARLIVTFVHLLLTGCLSSTLPSSRQMQSWETLIETTIRRTSDSQMIDFGLAFEGEDHEHAAMRHSLGTPGYNPPVKSCKNLAGPEADVRNTNSSSHQIASSCQATSVSVSAFTPQ